MGSGSLPFLVLPLLTSGGWADDGDSCGSPGRLAVDGKVEACNLHSRVGADRLSVEGSSSTGVLMCDCPPGVSGPAWRRAVPTGSSNCSALA